MAADSSVNTIGIVGPAGPATVAVGSVITTRGAMAVGNASGVPISLAVGASGTYVRSNGTDKLNSVILAADLPTGIDAAKLADGTVSNTELQHINSLTSNAQTQFAGKAALAHTHILNTERGIFIDQSASSSATPSDNTTSLVTWAVALSMTVVLPTGTWVVHADASCNLQHSAAGSSQFRVSINAQDSSPRTHDSLSATVYTNVSDNNQLSGQSGSIVVAAQFRGFTAGTTYAKNPRILVICERTA